MDDKLTRKSQEALSAAVRRAAADGSPQVESLHLLLALLDQADGMRGACGAALHLVDQCPLELRPVP